MREFLNKYLNPTMVLAVAAFLLPWQSRYIFGWSYLSGDPTQFGVLSVYAVQVILIVALFAAYAWTGRPVFDRAALRLKAIGGVFLLIAVISAYFAPQSVPALAAVVDLTFALIFFLALLDQRVDKTKVMFGFALGLVLPVALGVYQVITGGNPPSTILGLAYRDAEHLGDAVIMIKGERVLRAYGSFPHPNVFGGFLSVGLLSLLALRTPPGREGLGEASINDKTRRTLTAILVIILFAGLIFTESRSAMLGLLLGLALIALIRNHRADLARRLVLPLTTLVVVAALAISSVAPWIGTSIRGGGELEDRSLSERAEQYQSWPSTMHGTDWIIGNGPRNYVFALAEQNPGKSVWDYQPIHNVPLLMLSELGLLGLAIVVLGLVLIVRVLLRRLPDTISTYAVAMLAVLTVVAFFDHYLWSSWSGLALTGFVLALCMSKNNFVENHIDKIK